ncbi:MAG: phage baseplate assembly protein V [Streptosporangiaceae bacterium]
MTSGNGAQYLPGAGEGPVPQWLGIYQGYIAVNQDPLDQGRVKLRVPQVFGAVTSGWAAPMVPVTFIPKVGTQVTAMFVGGDPSQPVWFGNFAVPENSSVTTGSGPPPDNPDPVPVIGSIYYEVNSAGTILGMFEWNGVGWVDYFVGGILVPETQIYANPNVNTLFTIQPPNIAGTLEAVFELSTPDTNQTQPSTLGSLLLDPAHVGTTAKQATVLTSPYASEGAAMILEGQNDAGTDSPIVTLGSVQTQGSSMVFSPSATFFGYGTLFYASAAQTVVKIFTSSGTWTAPAGVTNVKVEVWAAGGGSAASVLNNFLCPGPGGGGAEFAAELTNTCAPGNVYTITVGAGGDGGTTGAPNGQAGGNSSFTGTGATTVTAHGGGRAIAGTNATPSGTPGAAGDGSANSIHFPGGAGGSTNLSFWEAGAGGGSSAGTGAAGNPGSTPTNNAGANGGAAVSGGGQGGKGGKGGNNINFTPGAPGASGTSPGAGAGGAGSSYGGAGVYAGAAGIDGMVRLTYTTGTPVMLASLAAQSGTDQFGVGFPAGFNLSMGAAGGKVMQIQNLTANPSAATVLALTAAAGDYAYGVQVTGQSFASWKNDSNGQQYWGPGNATQDVHLYRSSAGTLATELLVASVSGAGATWQSLGALSSGTVNKGRYRMLPDGEVKVEIDVTFPATSGPTPPVTFANTLPSAYQVPGSVDVRSPLAQNEAAGSQARVFVGSVGGSQPGQVQIAGFTALEGTYSAYFSYSIL